MSFRDLAAGVLAVRPKPKPVPKRVPKPKPVPNLNLNLNLNLRRRTCPSVPLLIKYLNPQPKALNPKP
jgi:hypothetical protein